MVNGSASPYATDVGEIQNALPRWGLLHPSGYPLYSILGSTFVTVLRGVGIQPALGSSLFSMMWGLIGVGVLVLLALELGVSGPMALVAALCVGLSTSLWMDSSLAEVHSMSLAFTLTSLWLAVRFSRTGRRRDLLWLAVIFTQGVAHQRAVAAIAPALLILVWNQWRVVLAHWKILLVIALGMPLIYFYLTLRKWMGVDWYFGTPETLNGLWAILHDNVFVWPESPAVWWERIKIIGGLLAQDMFWPLLLVGWAGLIGLMGRKPRRLGLGLTAAWPPYILIALIIWENRVSDAELASKLPAVALAGLGVALVLEALKGRWPKVGWAAAGLLGLFLLGWAWQTRPTVLAVTRDRSAEPFIATAARVPPASDGRAVYFLAPWGTTYWALKYAQAYQGQFPHLRLVDQNYALENLLENGDHLLVLDWAFYNYPVSWWPSKLGVERLYLSLAEPGVVEFSPTPFLAEPASEPFPFELNDDVAIRAAGLSWDNDHQLRLTVHWEAQRATAQNYSVAAHLLASDSTELAQPILAQADAAHPVDGWYPTSQWQAGEVVRDVYTLEVPDKNQAVAVRIALYYADSAGGFVNSRWFYLPVPKED